MDIEIIKEKKRQLEREIADVIETFEVETRTRVEAVEVYRGELGNGRNIVEHIHTKIIM